jgi:hypothetical protein
MVECQHIDVITYFELAWKNCKKMNRLREKMIEILLHMIWQWGQYGMVQIVLKRKCQIQTSAKHDDEHVFPKKILCTRLKNVNGLKWVQFIDQIWSCEYKLIFIWSPQHCRLSTWRCDSSRHKPFTLSFHTTFWSPKWTDT